MQQVALNLPNIWPKIASFYQKLLSNFDLLFGSLKRPKVVEMQQKTHEISRDQFLAPDNVLQFNSNTMKVFPGFVIDYLVESFNIV